MSYTRVREIVKEKFQEIGLDVQKYGLHSLWAGGVTAAANARVPDRKFKRYSRWKSERWCEQKATGIQIIGHLDVSCLIQDFFIAGFSPKVFFLHVVSFFWGMGWAPLCPEFLFEVLSFLVLSPSSQTHMYSPSQNSFLFNIKFSCNCTVCSTLRLYNSSIYTCALGLLCPSAFVH